MTDDDLLGAIEFTGGRGGEQSSVELEEVSRIRISPDGQTRHATDELECVLEGLDDLCTSNAAFGATESPSGSVEWSIVLVGEGGEVLLELRLDVIAHGAVAYTRGAQVAIPGVVCLDLNTWHSSQFWIEKTRGTTHIFFEIWIEKTQYPRATGPGPRGGRTPPGSESLARFLLLDQDGHDLCFWSESCFCWNSNTVGIPTLVRILLGGISAFYGSIKNFLCNFPAICYTNPM
jgi:hypothetical protein